jgi:crotonobetainyl-CoA:carnitine CoA-transferase CaiB-like acyl-CoA transferase
MAHGAGFWRAGARCRLHVSDAGAVRHEVFHGRAADRACSDGPAEAAIGPVYDIGQICDDPQYIARESITTVDDPDLGPLKMQNVFPRMVRTPGRVRHAGPRLGQHQREVLEELIEQGLPAEIAARLRAKAPDSDKAG